MIPSFKNNMNKAIKPIIFTGSSIMAQWALGEFLAPKMFNKVTVTYF